MRPEPRAHPRAGLRSESASLAARAPSTSRPPASTAVPGASPAPHQAQATPNSTSSSDSSEASGALSVRRGKAGGIFLASDLVPAVAVSSAVRLEQGAAIDALRARRVLERAVVLEAAEAATATDYAELERTIELLERHLGERPSVMRADAMFHRALVRACHNATIQAAMRGLARGLAPIRDAYSGGVERDRDTLHVHRRQLEAMRLRDMPALEQVLDEHFRMLEGSFAAGIGRRWDELFRR